MAGLYPAINDRNYDLIFKQAANWYDYALASGVTDLNPPNLTDNYVTLLKKIAYYTAAIAELP